MDIGTDYLGTGSLVYDNYVISNTHHLCVYGVPRELGIHLSYMCDSRIIVFHDSIFRGVMCLNCYTRHRHPTFPTFPPFRLSVAVCT